MSSVEEVAGTSHATGLRRDAIGQRSPGRSTLAD
jgi:hypothetical protein